MTYPAILLLLSLEEWGRSSVIYTAIFVMLIWLLWPNCRQWLLAQKIPGPPGFPVVGSSLQLQGDRAHTFQVINHWFKTYGHVFKTWSIINLTVFISNPVDIKLILSNKNLNNRSEYFVESIVYFVGGGLLTARDSKWKSHRKIINPIFHVNALETFVEVFVHSTERLILKLDKVADGRNLDFSQYISLLTIETICKTVIVPDTSSSARDTHPAEDDGRSAEEKFRKRSKSFKDESLPGGEEAMKRFYHAVLRSEEVAYARVFYPWLMIPWFQRLFSVGREAIHLRKEIQSFMKGVHCKQLGRNKQHQQIPSGVKNDQPNNNKKEALEDEPETVNKLTTLLDLLIRSSKENDTVLSPKRIRDEILGIMLAGLETSATSISHLLILLGIHGDVQDEIARELDEIFECDPREVTAAKLPRLKTLERAIKESLRLFPAVPLIPREIPEDLQLSSGLVLPAGSNVMIYPYLTHRSDKYFPNPDEFIPDRWLPENRSEIHPFAYIPFGAGVRNCIGQKYAMLQIKTVVSTLLRRYKVTTRYTMEDLKRLTVGVTLKLNGKCELQFQKR